MPQNRKSPKKPKEDRPHSLYTARVVEAVAIKIDQLPHLTFYGLDLDHAKRSIMSELARRDPQGYSVAYPDSS